MPTPTGRSPPCSPRSSSPTVARSPSGPSAPPPSSAPGRSPSSPTRTASREHRLKADEAYQIGEEGHPVRAYLDHENIVAVAVECGADAIYPGYGFLSENPLLAEACEANGITFIGPPASALHLAGNKARAIAAAREAGLPTLDSAAPDDRPRRPGRGGRGHRLPGVRQGRLRRRRARHAPGRRPVDACASRSRRPSARPRPPSATRRSTSSRPWSTRGTSRCRCSPTRTGDVSTSTSATARCSAATRRSSRSRRRPTSTPTPARRCAPTPCASPSSIGYLNAGTVEFLLGEDGRYVFIEMNPRIQVEHTVTEEVTDIDLVVAQMRIAVGRDLRRPGHAPGGHLRARGLALQCRITTEDPANGFRPDAGQITVYRSAGGGGVRLDGGTVFVGAEVSAHFDSMLVKLTCRGRTFPMAVRRARRALAEFRIRGVSTNIPFLEAVLADPVFQHGRGDDHASSTSGPSCSRPGWAPTAAPSCSPTSPTSPSTSPTAPPRPASSPRTKLPGHRPRRPAAAGRPRPARRRSGRPRSRAQLRERERRRRSPTRPSATPTRRCSPPGCAPATCSTSPGTSRT